MVGLTYRPFLVIKEFGVRGLKTVINLLLTFLLSCTEFGQHTGNTVTELLMFNPFLTQALWIRHRREMKSDLQG